MNRAVKYTTGLLLAGFSSVLLALGSGELDNLKNRLEQDPILSDPDYNQAVDIKDVSRDWRTNPARAQLKYNKPNGYRGKLKRILTLDSSTYDLVFDGGDGNEITASLFPYQLGPWVRLGGEWRPKTVLTTMEVVALYDIGQEFFLSCGHTLPGQLRNCLVFPAEVVK